jgi:hypothetical protein
MHLHRVDAVIAVYGRIDLLARLARAPLVLRALTEGNRVRTCALEQLRRLTRALPSVRAFQEEADAGPFQRLCPRLPTNDQRPTTNDPRPTTNAHPDQSPTTTPGCLTFPASSAEKTIEGPVAPMRRVHVTGPDANARGTRQTEARP